TVCNPCSRSCIASPGGVGVTATSLGSDGKASDPCYSRTKKRERLRAATPEILRCWQHPALPGISLFQERVPTSECVYDRLDVVLGNHLRQRRRQVLGEQTRHGARQRQQQRPALEQLELRLEDRIRRGGRDVEARGQGSLGLVDGPLPFRRPDGLQQPPR